MLKQVLVLKKIVKMLQPWYLKSWETVEWYFYMKPKIKQQQKINAITSSENSSKTFFF